MQYVPSLIQYDRLQIMGGLCGMRARHSHLDSGVGGAKSVEYVGAAQWKSTSLFYGFNQLLSLPGIELPNNLQRHMNKALG